jgi:two-component system, OmpR family, copper resistance phosphate regulon response regulator CusR
MPVGMPSAPSGSGPPARHRILLVEDDDGIAAPLRAALQGAGYDVVRVASGRDALGALDATVDAVVLDLGLPDLDGIEVCRRLHDARPSLPVLVLTARASEADVVVGLDAGADDYVTKPFRFDELLARIRARLRLDGTTESTLLRHGAVTLDLRTRRADVDGRSVELTAREFVLLEVLLRHPGQVLSREQLLSHVWGYDFEPASNVVEVYIGYLRRKLGKEHIVTLRGMGYAVAA